MYTTKSKLNIFKRSLSYAGALVWNSIPTDIKKCGHIKQFCFEMFKLAKRMECFLIQELLLCHYLHRQMKIYNPCLQMHIARAWQIHCPAAQDKSKSWLGKWFFYFTCPEKCKEYIRNIVIPSYLQAAVDCWASGWNLNLSGPDIAYIKLLSIP